jgi:hypothetical protein
MPCGDRGRDWSYVAMSYGTPRIVSNHQKLGRSKERSFTRVFRENMVPQFMATYYGSPRKPAHHFQGTSPRKKKME